MKFLRRVWQNLWAFVRSFRIAASAEFATTQARVASVLYTLPRGLRTETLLELQERYPQQYPDVVAAMQKQHQDAVRELLRAMAPAEVCRLEWEAYHKQYEAAVRRGEADIQIPRPSQQQVTIELPMPPAYWAGMSEWNNLSPRQCEERLEQQIFAPLEHLGRRSWCGKRTRS